jgi:hypothetical protein
MALHGEGGWKVRAGKKGGPHWARIGRREAPASARRRWAAGPLASRCSRCCLQSCSLGSAAERVCMCVCERHSPLTCWPSAEGPPGADAAHRRRPGPSPAHSGAPRGPGRRRRSRRGGCRGRPSPADRTHRPCSHPRHPARGSAGGARRHAPALSIKCAVGGGGGCGGSCGPRLAPPHRFPLGAGSRLAGSFTAPPSSQADLTTCAPPSASPQLPWHLVQSLLPCDHPTARTFFRVLHPAG